MIHVYVGPTLRREEPLLNGPRVRVLPPVRHGDLLGDSGDAIADEDTVLLIDGAHHQAPVLRHKEILALMSRGVRVIGAAGIGALRAAEMDQFGMMGVGKIYTAYARGEIEGDDEVAVGQRSDGDHRAVSWPLVNLRYALQLAEREGGILGPGAAAGLLEAFRTVYYPRRTTAAVLSVCRRHAARRFGSWLRRRHSRTPHFADLKRLDALEALRTATSRLQPRPAPPEPAASPQCWDAIPLWSTHFAVQEIDRRLAYQQLFDPDFKRVWLTYLDHRSRHPGSGDGPGMTLAERMAQLTSSQTAALDECLPAYAVFHPPVDLTDPSTLEQLLGREAATARATIAHYASGSQETGYTREFSPEAIKDSVAHRILLGLWRVPEHEANSEAWARGFQGTHHAIAALKPFLVGFLHDAHHPRRDHGSGQR
ncbi:TfuA-like protein [Streptomyces violaceusniger]|uniref:TfuA-like protein n=1 Tax=Streptomyces violaceusniger TaxID=68280 RepID=UPI003431EDE2